MATTRPSKTPTNLKDRIAALEQRNSTIPATPSLSPSTPSTPTANSAQSVGTLKDKIAKFERKGGVPVPRGSFGLGAPPTVEGPRRQGELYGNRIPGLTPQYTGGSLVSLGSFPNSSQRRSFSASVLLTGNFDDSYLDSVPIPTPTSAVPLDYPPNSPESSPSRATNGDIPVVRRNAARGTSFHEALEFARKVEATKQEALVPPIRIKSDSADTNEKSFESSTPISVLETHSEEATGFLGPPPAILVSSDDITPPGSPAVDEPPLQSNAALVETLASKAEVKPHVVDGSEMKRDLSPAGSMKSDNQITTIAESVNGTATPDVLQPSTSTILVAEPEQMPLPVSPLLETHPNGKHEHGRNVESNSGESDSVQTPQIVLNDVHSVAENIEAKLDATESKLPDDRKDLSPDIETPATAAATPKEVDTSPVPTKAVPIEVLPLATVQPLRTRTQIPVPRVKPTIQPPDPSSFLSPPPSGFRTAQFSSDGSVSSVGSRPASMIELSPSEVSRALKMTPATGRGIPVFLPPSTKPQARKSDFVYFPLSPEENPNPRLHKAGSESDLSSSFKAVVHAKVKEIPASATVPTKRQLMPETPMKNPKRATILQSPLSPGHGELATLLQEAMLLEDTLNKGELPGESPVGEAQDAKADPNDEPLDAEKSNEEERRRIAQAGAQLRSKRDLPTAGRLKHTFLMPLSKARAQRQEQSTPVQSTPVEQAFPQSPREDYRVKSAVPDHAGAREVVHERSASLVPQSPSKIPKPSKFSGLKRFGSISRTAPQQDALLRHSTSISSEDSNLIVTPPDIAPMEFGERRPIAKDVDQQSVHSQAHSFSFPSLSPKKGGIGRAASFAEKMWSRARTKSNGSALSSSETRQRSTEELTPQLPVLSELPPWNMPSLASMGPPLVPEKDLRFSTPSTAPAPFIPASYAQPKTPTSENISLIPYNSSAKQPISPAMSPIGELPSPLFDQDICDAFPSVPTNTPAQVSGLYMPRVRVQGFTAAATAASADFDSALMSSAIHLAARNQATASTDSSVPPTTTR